MHERLRIYKGNCLTILSNFPEESIDMVITSPPYYGLRDYGIEDEIWINSPFQNYCKHEWKDVLIKTEGYSNKKIRWTHGETRATHPEAWEVKENRFGAFCTVCNAWKGSLGLEPTLNTYLDNLMSIFKEIHRVLKKTGTCWVNIGDSYGNPAKKEKAGCLLMVPEIFALRMIRELGFYLRNTVIWKKPNVKPESCTNRFTRDFEPLYFFTKINTGYYFEQQFERYADSYLKDKRIGKQNIISKNVKEGYEKAMAQNPSDVRNRILSKGLGVGRNRRCVWSINTSQVKDAHFAVYPEELIEIPIRAGCPKFICKKCGKPKTKLIDKTERINTRAGNSLDYSVKSHSIEDPNYYLHETDFSKYKQRIIYKDLGYVSNCECNIGFDAGTLLDPFFGTGTTGVVGLKEGLNVIGIEKNEEYIKIAEKNLEPLDKKYKRLMEDY